MLSNALNRYQAWAEFAAGKETPESKPTELSIGLTNNCNLHCVYCAEQRPGNSTPRARLEGEVLDDLMALVPYAQAIAWHGISEFFLDRRFFEVVECSAAASALLTLSTNGTVFTDRHARALTEYPAPICINFSVDASSAAVYREVRGFHFDTVLANIRRYMAAFKQRRRETWSTLSFVIARCNVHEMEPFVRLAHDIGVKGVIFYRLHSYEGLDWKVKTAVGTEFDYRAQRVENFPDLYNANARLAAVTASELGIDLNVPAEFAGDG
jgi:MoaA/NifB/PqqE/SkfB family radical SAM enzyme